MVMQIEPIDRLITKLKGERSYDEVIYMSPDGELLDQPLANRMSRLRNLIILCGHYKGVDERVREHLITREISIGNFVLTGAYLAHGRDIIFNGYQPFWDGLSSMAGTGAAIWGLDLYPGQESSVGLVEYLP